MVSELIQEKSTNASKNGGRVWLKRETVLRESQIDLRKEQKKICPYEHRGNARFLRWLLNS